MAVKKLGPVSCDMLRPAQSTLYSLLHSVFLCNLFQPELNIFNLSPIPLCVLPSPSSLNLHPSIPKGLLPDISTLQLPSIIFSSCLLHQHLPAPSRLTLPSRRPSPTLQARSPVSTSTPDSPLPVLSAVPSPTVVSLQLMCKSFTIQWQSNSFEYASLPVAALR